MCQIWRLLRGVIPGASSINYGAFPSNIRELFRVGITCICSSLSTRQRNGAGLWFPPKVPPIWSSSMAWSTIVSAVRAKQCSFQYASPYILLRVIFSIRFCGFVPWTCDQIPQVSSAQHFRKKELSRAQFHESQSMQDGIVASPPTWIAAASVRFAMLVFEKRPGRRGRV